MQSQGARLSHSFVLPFLALAGLDDGWGFKGSTATGGSRGGLDGDWGSPGWLGSTAQGSRGVGSIARKPDVKVEKLENHNNIWQHMMIDHVCKDGRVAFQDGFSAYADANFYCKLQMNFFFDSDCGQDQVQI
ncbi:uncharacterized protein LOC133804274 [Humulus lupulus]|uniref:uncharacterized protein LOC133804274 n=1 Tax=Humulus lupulus TaxID=3486 RepID=UPI002B415557|nr:uncharacterized protein LOC133804274 [Humulus lupulus]